MPKHEMVPPPVRRETPQEKTRRLPVVGVKGFLLRSAMAVGSLFAAKSAYESAPDTSVASVSEPRRADAVAHEADDGGAERLVASPRRAPAEVAPTVLPQSELEGIRIVEGSMEDAFARDQEALDAAQRERVLNGPILDRHTVELTGETEMQNMLAEGDVDAYIGRPAEFRALLERRLHQQLRTEGAMTNEVMTGINASKRVLQQEAAEAQERGDPTRSVALLELAGDEGGVVRVAHATRRPDLALQALRRLQEASNSPDSDVLGGALIRSTPEEAASVLRESSSAERARVAETLREELENAQAAAGRARDLVRANNDGPLPPDPSERQNQEEILRSEQEQEARIRRILEENFSS